MNRLKHWLLLLPLLCFATSCSETIDPDSLLEGENMLMLFTNLQINNIEWSKPLDYINDDSEKFQKFAEWLNENKSGWKNDFQTYEFPQIMLTGSRLNFCVYNGFVVLMFEDYYYTKNTDTDKLQFLINDIKNTFYEEGEEATVVISTQSNETK